MSFFEEATIAARQYLVAHAETSKSQLIEFLSSKGFSKLQIMGSLQKVFDISLAESKRVVLEDPIYERDLTNLYKALDLAVEANFQTVLAYYDWQPISNCPGRYVLKGEGGKMSPLELVGDEYESQEFVSEHVTDPICVVPFSDGGLISYRKPDGTYVHTLGNREGFQRKIAQLGIQLKENS